MSLDTVFNDLSWLSFYLLGVAADVEASQLQSWLEPLDGMGGVEITREGLCHSFEWEIKWLQSGGDRPDLILDTTNVEVSSI